MLSKLKEIVINVAIGCFITAIFIAIFIIFIIALVLFAKHFPALSAIIVNCVLVTITGIGLYMLGANVRESQNND